MSESAEIKKGFVHDLFTPRTVVALFAAFAWAVVFWKDSQENWHKTEAVAKKIENKTDDADFQALKDRVNRQYESMNKLNDRIIDLEKQAEYQRGYLQGQK